MWECLQQGACALIEMPSRWYFGVVATRTSMTVRLSEVICGHDLGDLGLLLDGKVSTETELTPMPRDVELSLGAIESAQEYPLKYLRAIRRRTHAALGERQ